MDLKRAAKVVLASYAPVIASILLMIVVRSHDLAREAVEGGLSPGFFVPLTATQAITSGFTIWIPGALGVGILAYALHWELRERLHFGRWSFLAITTILGVLMAGGLIASGNSFAPEGAFEMLACGVGYGILVPYFAQVWPRGT